MTLPNTKSLVFFTSRKPCEGWIIFSPIFIQELKPKPCEVYSVSKQGFLLFLGFIIPCIHF
jgi:hypothetical protein